jgi:YggT family protein
MLDSLMLAFGSVILGILSLYKWIVIIAALITWINPDPYNPIVQILFRLTEPVYAKIRRVIPTVFGGIDLAPIILLFGIQFLEIFLGSLFFR